MLADVRVWALVCAGALAVGCGAEKEPGDSALSAAAPLVSIASPVAPQTSGSAAQGLSFQALSTEPDGGTPPPPPPGGQAPEAKSYAQLVSELKGRLERKTAAECLAGLQFSAPAGHPSCYGPSLYYLHHPDATAGGSMGPGNCPITGDGNGCLPGGDLGIWAPTEGAKNEACTAATMNAQVHATGALINNSISLMAGMICVAKVEGQSLPEVDKALDLAGSLAKGLPGATFTAARLSRLADQSDGRATFQIDIDATVNGSAVRTRSTHATSSDHSSITGLLRGWVDLTDPHQSQPVRRGFSVVYALSGGTLRYELRSATTPTSATESELFDGNGRYRFDVFSQQGGSPSHSNARHELAQLEVATGLGTLSHAWQAGGTDGYTRVFQAHTRAVSGGPDQGYGYFGFGPAVTSSAVGKIEGMWCNWAGPGHTKGPSGASYNSTQVQAQTMARDAATGVFQPVLNKITYAPTNSCSAVGTSFVYSTTANSNAALEGLAAADVVEDLVPYGDASIGAIPVLTAPTF